MAAIHKDLRGRMVELGGPEAFHDGDVVDDARRVGNEMRKLRARLAVALKAVRRPQQLGRALDEGEALPLGDFRGHGLAIVLVQHRLVVEHVQLGWRARHKQKNDAFGSI